MTVLIPKLGVQSPLRVNLINIVIKFLEQMKIPLVFQNVDMRISQVTDQDRASAGNNAAIANLMFDEADDSTNAILVEPEVIIVLIIEIWYF